MKKFLILLTALILLPALVVAEPASVPASATASTEAAPEMSAEEKAKKEAEQKALTMYALGYLMGQDLQRQLIIEDENEFKYINQGMRDSMTGKDSQADINFYRPLIQQRYRADGATLKAAHKAEQDKFYAAAEKERNTEKLSNGVLVKTLTKGKAKGKIPAPKDMVKVHYTGTLIDGTVFDSSHMRGKPADLPLDGVISCWTTGIQKMKEGAKARLICPSETAYGPMQVSELIPGDSMLVFEVELLEVIGK